MPSISMSSVDLIDSKLKQAMVITRLIQGDSSSDSPLKEEYIDYALSAVFDLISDSKKLFRDETERKEVTK